MYIACGIHSLLSNGYRRPSTVGKDSRGVKLTQRRHGANPTPKYALMVWWLITHNNLFTRYENVEWLRLVANGERGRALVKTKINFRSQKQREITLLVGVTIRFPRILFRGLIWRGYWILCKRKSCARLFITRHSKPLQSKCQEQHNDKGGLKPENRKILAENVFDWGGRNQNSPKSKLFSSEQLYWKIMPSHSLRDVTTPSSKMENLNFRTARSGRQESTNYLTSSCVQSLVISCLGVEWNLYTEQSAELKCNIAASPTGKYPKVRLQ
jgi:hypothetical protein